MALLAIGFWIGCATFFLLVTQILFNPDIVVGVSREIAGSISAAVLRRVFWITYLTGGTALFFLIVASFSGGKWPRRALALCVLLLGLNALNDLWILDRLNKIKLQKTNSGETPALKAQFELWHNISIGVYGAGMVMGGLAALCLLPAAGAPGKPKKSSK